MFLVSPARIGAGPIWKMDLTRLISDYTLSANFETKLAYACVSRISAQNDEEKLSGRSLDSRR